MKQGIMYSLLMALAVGTLFFANSITTESDVSASPGKGKPPAKIPVDKEGFDSQGRMVSYFGSPLIDGKIDDIWKKAPTVKPKHVSTDNTSATFKTLWDENALYILAEVKDDNLSVESNTPHMQDSVEIFLDENNDKTEEYGVDDLHIRINYENTLSVDIGNIEQYYTSAKTTEDGYVVEARIGLKNKPVNGSVFGIELQVNDAIGDEKVGSINVFDETGNAWKDTSTFGEIVLAGKKKPQVSGLNPYDLINLVNRTLAMDFTLYKNPSVVMDAIGTVTENTLISEDLTQDEIDEQYSTLEEAISKLEMTEEAANEKHFQSIPDEYRMESDQPGSIQTLDYQTPNVDGGQDDKKMHVYLPHGYDTSDSNEKYNVLYLMHGGGENEDIIFGGPNQTKELKKILDTMIEKGDIDPLIVVTPTFYGGKNEPAHFHEELLNDIVPLVETEYQTYAKSGSLDDIKASRAHRAFGGFSMGAVTTWFTFSEALDYFKYYMPLSGDSWAIDGDNQSAEKAEHLANIVRESEYTPEDFYIFSATGNQDIAYPNLKPQIDEMKKLTDTFIYSSDPNQGNFYFIDADGGAHSWYWQNQYIYNIMPDLFVDEDE